MLKHSQSTQCGIVPWRPFLTAENISMLLQFPNSTCIEPFKIVSYKFIIFNCWRWPNVLGMDPFKEEANPISLSSVHLEISSEMWPVKLLSPTLRTFNFFKIPISRGMVLERSLEYNNSSDKVERLQVKEELYHWDNSEKERGFQGCEYIISQLRRYWACHIIIWQV